MSAESILEQFAAKTGWTEQSQLALLCEYIDNQQSPDAFRDFLAEQAENEMDIGADS